MDLIHGCSNSQPESCHHAVSRLAGWHLFWTRATRRNSWTKCVPPDCRR